MEPRLAYHNRMWYPQELSPLIAAEVMTETSWTSLIYGIAASGKMAVYDEHGVEKIPLDRLYDDAVSLSLGVLTIALPHLDTCNRLICNCKIT